MTTLLRRIDAALVPFMRRWGIHILRVALGIVYFWFGALKLAGVSPVVDFIHATYWFFPGWFILFLGAWEVAIGLGLIAGVGLRWILLLFGLQLAGTFGSLVLRPEMFFVNGNLLRLTLEGEFVVKNIVFLAAGLAIGGHELAHQDSRS